LIYVAEVYSPTRHHSDVWYEISTERDPIPIPFTEITLKIRMVWGY
jgi:hypothetical protein